MRRTLIMALVMLVLSTSGEHRSIGVLADEVAGPPIVASGLDESWFTQSGSPSDSLVIDSLAHQMGPLPELGATLIDTVLTSERIFEPVTCQSGQNFAQFRNDGYQLSVSGRCRADDSFAGITSLGHGVIVPDGDVELHFRLLTGSPRATVQAYIRSGSVGWYRLEWNPASRTILWAKFQVGTFTVLAQRNDLPPVTDVTAMHTLGLRVQGSQLWGLIDGQPALMSSDAEFATGGIGVALERTGSADDAQEISASVQRLRISALAGSAPDRLPMIQQPSPTTPPIQTPGGAAPVQLPVTPGR